MKALQLTIVSIVVFTISLLTTNAQICSIVATPTQAGFYPLADSIPCVVQNQPYDATLQFVNFTQISVLDIEYLRIDSITNLPCGIRWTTSKQGTVPTHEFTQSEHGCIRFIGGTNDPVGQYKLRIFISLKASGVQNEIKGEYYQLGAQYGAIFDNQLYLRVTPNPSSNCPAIDTSSSAPNLTATCPSSDTINTAFFGRIMGKVFYDSNSNGVEDAGDYPLSNHKVLANNSAYALTDNFGNYTMYVTPGSYNITADVVSANYSVTSSPSTIPVNVTGGALSLASFGLYPNSLVNDVSITATNSNFRPGFSSTVWLTLSNNGNTPISSATVHYTYHDSMTFVQSVPPPSITSSNTLTWNVSNLLPGEQRTYSIAFELPISIDLLGTMLSTIAEVDSINGETDLNNNADPLDIIVTGSYDPNDKTPYPTGDLSEAFITSGKPLRYRIRFQNTGTDTAFNIVVRDTLDDTKFDVSSLKMLGASHNYNFHVEGGKHAVWEFPNILLPDSNVNEPGSHGYIMFDIDLVPGLTHGDEINNGAGIFFDFNPVVLTNIANSKVDFSVGVPELMSTIRPTVYPNPTNNMLYVELPEANSISIAIIDLSGKLVLQAHAQSGELATDVSSLQTGIYIVRITDQAGNMANRKLLINK